MLASPLSHICGLRTVVLLPGLLMSLIWLISDIYSKEGKIDLSICHVLEYIPYIYNIFTFWHFLMKQTSSRLHNSYSLRDSLGLLPLLATIAMFTGVYREWHGIWQILPKIIVRLLLIFHICRPCPWGGACLSTSSCWGPRFPKSQNSSLWHRL